MDIPLVRNAYSLAGSTLVTSGFGMAFWVVAARNFSPEIVGINSALISTMLLLAGISTLNLANGFNRFIPTAGHRARRFVIVGYSATVGFSVVVALLFVAGTTLWADELSFLRDDPTQCAWFVASVALWGIFMLQDGVLAGLGEGPWVLAENLVYGVVKLALLFAVALGGGRYGVFTAWTAPLVFLVAAITWLVFCRLLPARDDTPIEDTDLRAVSRLVGVDYLATLMTTGMQGLLPLLVLAVAGPSDTAYVVLAWTVAYPLHLLSLNVGMAMTTEAAQHPKDLLGITRHSVAHALRIVGTLAVLLVVSAPLLLRVFGADYAENSTRSLQLFALASVPYVFVATFTSAARVRRRMWLVVAVTTAYAAITLGLAALLLRVVGIDGVGLAWLAGTTVVAGVLLLGDLRALWLHRIRPAHVPSLSRAAHAFVTYRNDRAARRVAHGVIAGLQVAEGWEPVARATNHGGLHTIGVRDRTRGQDAVLRVATDAQRRDRLRDEAAALGVVARIAPTSLRPLVPEVAAGRLLHDPAWLLERRPSGAAPATAPLGRRLIDEVVERMCELYAVTSAQCDVEAETIAAHLATRIPATGRRSRPLLAGATDFRDVAESLAQDLEGMTLTTAVVHGNLWPGCVLRRAGEPGPCGIADWFRVHRAAPVIDIAHLLCTNRALTRRIEFGAVIRTLIDTDKWDPDDADAIAPVPGASELSPRTVALLAWLMHVSTRNNHPHSFGAHEVWLAHNVHLVLENL